MSQTEKAAPVIETVAPKAAVAAKVTLDVAWEWDEKRGCMILPAPGLYDALESAPLHASGTGKTASPVYLKVAETAIRRDGARVVFRTQVNIGTPLAAAAAPTEMQRPA